MQTGGKLKRLRKNKQITLAQLSKQTGLSVSFLSNMEREATSPTLQQLEKICLALETTILDFLAETPAGPGAFVKRGDFEEVFSLKAGIRYELALCGQARYKCVCITLQPGCNRAEHSHELPEDNVVFVTEGVLELEMAGERYTLCPHDVLLVPAKTPHSYQKRGDGACASYWFALAPCPPDAPVGLPGMT